MSGEIVKFMAVLSGRFFAAFRNKLAQALIYTKPSSKKNAVPENNLWLLKGPDYRQQPYNRAQAKDSPVRRRKETP
jgi:hypothetical protein